MFYCQQCQQEKGWPESFSRSHGNCEICGRTRLCFDVPSRALPPPKKKRGRKKMASKKKKKA